MKDTQYIYIFNDLVHLKRILFFLKGAVEIKNNLHVCLTDSNKNEELALFKKNEDSQGIEFLKINKKKFGNLQNRFKEKKVSLVIDRNLSEKEFIFVNLLYKKENFSIVFLEHNSHYQWEHIFNLRTGYTKRNLLHSLKTKNIYKLLFRVYFSNLRNRALSRRVSPLDIINYGIIPFVDKIYLYSDSSYKYLQRNKNISKINTHIIKYPFQTAPIKPKESNYFRVCIYSVGCYKSNNKRVIDRQTEYLKFIINFIRAKYNLRETSITIKFKTKEMEKANIIFSNYQSSFLKITDKDIRNSFDLVIVPIDSFLVIEYLRGNVPFFVYNIYPKLGPIGEIAKQKNIKAITK